MIDLTRREALAMTVAIALVPSIGETRERRIGWGRDPDSDRMLHEEYAVERWDGSKWTDTYERRGWWYVRGERVEKRWKLTKMEIELWGGK